MLAVNAQMPSEALRTRFPTQVKIGPVERIRDLVNLQLPGVALRPLPVAPRQIPFHAGFNYFELETRGSELWHQLETIGRRSRCTSPATFPASSSSSGRSGLSSELTEPADERQTIPSPPSSPSARSSSRTPAAARGAPAPAAPTPPRGRAAPAAEPCAELPAAPA